MTNDHATAVPDQDRWLTIYYFARAVFSALWVIAAFTVGRDSAAVAALLFLLYPAWDAAANYLDASRSGGLGRNRTQAVNVAVSLATTLAVGFALRESMNGVLGVFGAWAVLAGLLQLGTAISRWKRAGAQWAMVLSGGQSALAGGLFIAKALTPTVPTIATVAGYAGVGAAYFLVSAVWLTVARLRRGDARTA